MELRSARQHRLNLASLPRLVTDHVMCYLDAPALKQLRLVSKTTKEWVEQPKHLKKLSVVITHNRRGLDALLRSTVQWNNFTIGNHGYSPVVLDPFERNARSQFITRYGKTMKCCISHRTKLIRELLDILIGSPELESLDLEFCDEDTFVLHALKTMAPSQLQELRKSLGHLKYLNVNCLRPAGSLEPHSFEFFLQSCMHLENIVLPKLSGKSSQEIKQHIYAPLLKYMDRVISSSNLVTETQTTRPKLVIDFKEHRTKYFELESQTFLGVVQRSSQINAELRNVPNHILPRLSSLRPEHYEMLDKTVTSVFLGCQSPYGLRDVHLPKHCTLQAELNSQLAKENPEFQHFEIRGVVEKLSIQFLTVESHLRRVLHSSHIFNKIQALHCPSLKNLEIESHLSEQGECRCWFCAHEALTNLPSPGYLASTRLSEINQSSMTSTLTAAIIASNFSGLQKLRLTFPIQHTKITEVEIELSCKTFNNLLKGLPMVQEIALINCWMLTDKGILGTDNSNPLIVNLKKLTHLDLQGCSITQISFMRAFRLMKLKIFKFFPNKMELSKQEEAGLKKGIFSLATAWDGLADTLETLDLLLPFSMDPGAIQRKFKKLTNIKVISMRP